MKPLSKTEQKILLTLGEGGESTMYQISKRGAYYPNVHRAMNGLRRQGLVDEVRRERGQKGGMKRVYDLTRDGEIALVATIRSLKFDEFAKRPEGWMNKIPPLSRWSVLKERKATAVAKILLQEASRRVLKMTDQEISESASIERVFAEIEITIKKQAGKEDLGRWNAAIHIDDELAQWYEQNMKEALEKHVTAARSIKQELKNFQLARKSIKKARKEGIEEGELERIVSRHLEKS